MPVELRPENVTAYRVFSQCRGQLITRGMDGTPIDISIPAVETMMEWMGIKRKHRGRVGLKVLVLARQEIRAMRDAREQKAEG